MTEDRIDVEKLTNDAFTAIDALFSDDEEADLFSEDIEPERDQPSNFDRLDEYILAMEWEYSEKEVNRFNNFLSEISSQYSDKHSQDILKMMISIVQYIIKAQDKALPETHHVLESVLKTFKDINQSDLDETTVRLEKKATYNKVLALKNRIARFNAESQLAADVPSETPSQPSTPVDSPSAPIKDSHVPLSDESIENSPVVIGILNRLGQCENRLASLESQNSKLKQLLNAQQQMEQSIRDLKAKHEEIVSAGSLPATEPFPDETRPEEISVDQPALSFSEEDMEDALTSEDSLDLSGQGEISSESLPDDELGFDEVNPEEIHFDEVGSDEINFGEISSDADHFSEINPEEIHFEEVSPDEMQLDEVKSGAGSGEPGIDKQQPDDELPMDDLSVDDVDFDVLTPDNIEYDEITFDNIQYGEDAGDEEETEVIAEETSAVPGAGSDEAHMVKDSRQLDFEASDNKIDHYVRCFNLGGQVVALPDDMINNVYKIPSKIMKKVETDDSITLGAFSSFFQKLSKNMTGSMKGFSNGELKKMVVDVRRLSNTLVGYEKVVLCSAGDKTWVTPVAGVHGEISHRVMGMDDVRNDFSSLNVDIEGIGTIPFVAFDSNLS